MLNQTSVIIKTTVFISVGLTMHATILAHMFSLVETNKVSEPLFPAGSVQYPSNQVFDIIILHCPTTILYLVTMNKAKLSTFFHIQSTPLKTDTVGTGTKCPSQLDVRLVESQIKEVKKGRDQLSLSVLPRCPLRECRL